MALQPASTSPQLSYKKTILPNGIRVVTEEIPYVRSISIGAWIDVGSRDEDDRTNGISHFLEHMVFKGTRRFRMKRIAQSLESVGGYLNAFTTKEHTCFYARILDEHLKEATDVISDLVQHPTFPQREMEKEKQVVIEEIKNIEDDPDDLIHDYFDRSLYRNHPLSYPIVGTVANITSFTQDLLNDYLSKHYIPGRIVVAAAGRLSHDRLLDLVDKYFSGPAQADTPRKPTAGIKTHRSKKEIFEKPITQSHICVGTLGCSVKSRQRFPLLLLNTILGEGMSSRLFQNIREKYGFAYSVYSFANTMSDTGNFGVYIGTDKNNIDNSIGLIFKELEKLVNKPVSATELRRAKAQVKGSMMLSLENTSSRMMRLGSGELYYRHFMQIDEIVKKIDAVTIDDVHDLAQRLIDPAHFSTVIFRPAEGEPEPLLTVA